jgi:hypothetical protein
MVELMALSDDDLAAQIRGLREEQLRRAGKNHACAQCGAEFHARVGARYCSGNCRVAAFRARSREAVTARTRGTR